MGRASTLVGVGLMLAVGSAGCGGYVDPSDDDSGETIVVGAPRPDDGVLTVPRMSPAAASQARATVCGSLGVAADPLGRYVLERVGVGRELTLRRLSGSAALTALRVGQVDAVVTGQPLSGRDRAEFVEHRLLRLAVGVVVHQKNPVHDLTRTQLSGILSGRLRTWQDLGGTARELDLVTLPAGDPFLPAALSRLFPPTTLRDRSVVETARAAVRRVAAHTDAVAVIPLASASGAGVRLLRVDGVAPRSGSGRYPLAWVVRAITHRQAAAGILRFVSRVRSPQVRERLRGLGEPAW